MSYFMRFVSRDPEPPTVSIIADHLKRLDPSFHVEDGTLAHGSIRLAQLEVNSRGEDLFEEERGELIEFATDAEGPGRERVIDLLKVANWVVAAQVLFGSSQPQDVLAKLEPVWSWLSTHYDGLRQADGEGWRDASGIILSDE